MKAVRLALLLAAAAALGSSSPAKPTPRDLAACGLEGSTYSSWVTKTPAGLSYKPLNSNGDRIMDFSSSGYMGGGVAIPSPRAAVALKPSGKDDTAAIQAAIDKVSQLSPGSDGFRGAVVLSAGTFTVKKTLNVTASGVVLRGSGSNSTLIQNSDESALALNVAGESSTTVYETLPIKDSYVPSGATTVTLSDAGAIKVGDTVLVVRTITDSWIKLMGGGSSWLQPGKSTSWQRTVVAVKDSRVTLDIPISDSIDSKYVSGAVKRVSVKTSLAQVGVEKLAFVGTPRKPATANNMMEWSNVEDSWLSDVRGHNFVGGVSFGFGTRRITALGVALTHSETDAGVPCTGAKPAEFSIRGSQILLDRCSSSGAAASFYVVTHALVPGPNVVLGFRGVPDDRCSMSSIQPHQRWATGLLVDGAALDANAHENSSVLGSICFTNRGSDGQGWTMGWGVVWNSAGKFNVQSPPGTTNWVIGGSGPVVQQSEFSQGTFDAVGTLVAPRSLYLAQLCLRLGPKALANIGH